MEFHKILAAVDSSLQGQKTLDTAIDISKNQNAELIIVSVFESDDVPAIEILERPRLEKAQNKVEEELKKWSEKAKKSGIEKVVTYYAEGKPGEVISNEVVPEVNPDLVVVGKHSKENWIENLGSEAVYMSKHVPSSILIVK